MAHFPMRAIVFLLALTLAAGAWFMTHEPASAQSSITVKLPPAHPATPRPAFAFHG